MTAGAASVIAHETLLSTWGNVGAIIGGLGVIVGGIWAWWRWFQGEELDHAMHGSNAPVAVQQMPDGGLNLDIGIALNNGSKVPLCYVVRHFDVIVGTIPNQLSKESAREELAPGQTREWRRHGIIISPAQFQDRIALGYHIDYGKHGRKVRRRIEGFVEYTLFPTGDRPSASIRHLQPERDFPLARKDRK